MDAPTPFARFAEAAEEARATASRLQKGAAVGRFFDRLSDPELAHAARYLAGYAFPLSDQRTTNVGGSLLFATAIAVTGSDPVEAQRRLVPLGDLGDLAEELFGASEAKDATPTLTIESVAAALDDLAGTPGSGRKAQLVEAMMRQATPLEAKYLVKLLAGDLRIGLQEGAVEDAIARWAGVPAAQVAWANMLLGDIGSAAVMARRGTLAEARMRLFHPLKFMLATPAIPTPNPYQSGKGDELSEIVRKMPAKFVIEDKYDGIRAQAHISKIETPGHTPSESSPSRGGAESARRRGMAGEGLRVALFSRTLDEITESFPDLVSPLAALIPPDAPPGYGLILDGEILAMEGDRVLKFRELQARLGRKTPGPELVAKVPVTFMAYDLLYAGDELKIDLPFRERRALLESLPLPASGVRIAPSVTYTAESLDLDAVFNASRARGNEGLMVKDPASTYKPGRRGREWLKIKRAMATLDVVVTAVEVGHGKRSGVLSDYTFAVRASEKDPTLLNVGKAYTGLTDAEIARMSEWFMAHTLQEFAHGRVRVVEPLVVIEVTFDLIQPSTRHKSGYAMRFPRIVRLRPDKPATEIDTLATVARLAAGEEDGAAG